MITDQKTESQSKNMPCRSAPNCKVKRFMHSAPFHNKRHISDRRTAAEIALYGEQSLNARLYRIGADPIQFRTR